MKKFLLNIFLIASFIFFATYTFATDSNMMQDATNAVRDMVGGAENAMEDAAGAVSNTSKNITGDMQEGLNNMMDNNDQNNTDTNNDNNGDDRNTTTGASTDNNGNGANYGNNGNNPGDYTAQRTATTTDGTIAGMNSTTWIWLIMAVLAIAIIALVYYYSVGMTTNNRNYHNGDE